MCMLFVLVGYPFPFPPSCPTYNSTVVLEFCLSFKMISEGRLFLTCLSKIFHFWCCHIAWNSVSHPVHLVLSVIYMSLVINQGVVLRDFFLGQSRPWYPTPLDTFALRRQNFYKLSVTQNLFCLNSHLLSRIQILLAWNSFRRAFIHLKWLIESGLVG